MNDGPGSSLPAGGCNVVVAGAPDATTSRSVYERWFEADHDGPVRVVVVTYLREPSTYAERWNAVADPPAEFVVVDARDSRGDASDGDFGRVVAAAPNDLTRLGIHVSESVDDWEGDVCFLFDSLSALLQFVDVETAYRFVHVLTSRMAAVDARAFYVLHASQHDPQTTSIFTQLADASLEHDRESDTWSVSTR